MDRDKSHANWKTQLRKGFLDLCILNCLNSGECYGYDLVQRLRKADGTAIREGIVYPVLARLEEDRLVTSKVRPSESGPPRKYYRITNEGREALNEINAYWRGMVSAADALIGLEGDMKDE